MRGPLIREKEVILARSIDLGQNANAAIFVLLIPVEAWVTDANLVWACSH